ncbi:hypothetical protein SAMN05421874_128102 [Nonomuraea maritima]|uniref:Uncharacterized protein n=2 Tax=Nonomuraea maritima TaxID=683260 RepID=A0A1G9MMD7_9ACTN|nr:hypothetical protein SAMN05421874_128102 [Nonomuraea maritima]
MAAKFTVASTQPETGSSVLDELIGAVPAQSPAPAGNKFVSQLDANSPLDEVESRITAATNEYVVEVGTLLGLVRDNEMWRKSETPYTSWEEYLRIRWDWTPQYANLLIRLVPIVQAVSPHSDRPVNAGQGKALWPIWTQDGGHDKAVEVFKQTPGKKSAAAITRTAVALGYIDEETKPQKEARAAAPPAVLSRFREFADLVSEGDGKHLIEAAKADPDWGKGALLPTLRQAVWMLESEFGDPSDD